VIVVGADPGKHGGLAWVESLPRGLCVSHACNLPLTVRGDLDLEALLGELERRPAHLAVLELAHAYPRMGAAGAFRYGSGYGALLCAFAARRYELGIEHVTGDKWHGDLFDLARRRKGTAPARGERGERDRADKLEGREAAKARAAELVAALWPELELPRRKDRREGVVDALCLAVWGHEHGGGYYAELARGSRGGGAMC